MKGGTILLPQSHKIISEHVHKNVKDILGVNLNKRSLIFGSIKPDIAYSLVKLDHFKPQSFNFICDEINKLSNYNFESNKKFINLISNRIGIVTHFISDFFCVPHNDRVTYENNFINHIKYEHKLHQLFKSFNEEIDISSICKDCLNLDNSQSYSIKNFIDALHLQYEKRRESLLNDLISSISVSSMVGLFIVYNALKQNMVVQVA